jgi:hypothetical protein
MKKILILLITVIMTFGLVGCSKSYKDVFKSYLKETAKLNAMEQEIYSKMAATDESNWIFIDYDTVSKHSSDIVMALEPLKKDKGQRYPFYEGEIGNLCQKYLSYMNHLRRVHIESDTIEEVMPSYIEYYNYLVESANKYGINLSDYGIVPIQWDTLK